MSVEFFGVGGPNQIGSLKKTGKSQAGDKVNKDDNSDSVKFSSVLQDVNRAQAAKGSSNSERTERVQELKSQIQEGSYQPDLNKVASSLVQFLIEEK